MAKGRVLVFTGKGKGKSTAAFGLALRAVGQGMKVLVVQFIKASKNTGEVKAARRLAPDLEVIPMGLGFIRTKDPAVIKRNKIRAANALRFAKEMIASEKYDLVILDEANNAVSCGLVEAGDIIGLIKSKPKTLHIVITGRYAKKNVIALADTVTEMKEIKHAYRKGIKAQKGIEF